MAQSDRPDAHAPLAQILFYLVLTLFIGHEMDAVWRHEWRMLPGFRSLSDQNGQIAFVLAHIPLFMLLFWLTMHPNDRLRRPSQLTVDALLIVHATVHAALSGHALYAFQPPVESITVYGAGLAALIHISLLMRKGRPR